MRVILRTSPPTKLVPFDYQKSLVSAFHKWIGKNNIHDEISLYSLSWLQGGKSVKNGLSFKYGAEWQVSSYDPELLKSVIKGIRDAPQVSFGMEVRNVTIVNVPNFRESEKFFLNSPVFLKRNMNDRSKFYLYNDKESDELMTQTMISKMKKANVDHEGLKISFDKTYHNPKTKKITFGGIDCRASFCPVIIEGTSEQLAFAWSVGVGNSTGIGFGALR